MQCTWGWMNLINISQTAVCMVFPLPHGFDTLLTELPTLPEQQDKLQPGVRDTAVPGLHLWEHNWGTWTSGSVYKREKRGTDQPDAGKSDRVLPGALPREPGNESRAVKCIPLPPWAPALPDPCCLITLPTSVALQVWEFFPL